MKKILTNILYILLVSMIFPASVIAQELSKSETKEIKAELKKFKKNPLLYKVKLQKLHNQIAECDGEIALVEKKVKDKERQMKVLNDSIRLMHSAIDMLVEEMEIMASGESPDYALEGISEPTASKPSTPAPSTLPKAAVPKTPEGTAYKVQIGQYKFLNISSYFDAPKLVNYEIVDGKYTYNIGYFNNYDDAKKFAADIKKMGITDAFVTKYSNGVRSK